jgi:hypothetical protein
VYGCLYHRVSDGLEFRSEAVAEDREPNPKSLEQRAESGWADEAYEFEPAVKAWRLKHPVAPEPGDTISDKPKAK